MNNRDRALALLNDLAGRMEDDAVSTFEAVQELHDTGLLAPDLPAPDVDSTFAFLGPTWEARKADGGVFIVTSRHGRVRTPGGEHSPAEARARAYALLAAADHADRRG